jgi:long-subunit acyl-CoA synthetase (AMP-forming)
MSGHISVPLYPTLSTNSINQILEHSESKLFFVGKLDDWESQKDGLVNIPRVNFPHWINSDCTSWKEFVGSQKALDVVDTPDPEDIATIIYTSGTTGMPKGVVHSHHSLSWPANEALYEFGLKNERFFSYLPLSHIAERLLIEMGSLYSEGEIYFAESLDSFPENLKYAKPTIFLAVPRIWTKFEQGILKKMNSKKLKTLLKIPFLNNVIRKKIKAGLGLDQCKVPLTGAAPISKDLLFWFKDLGIEILEVYGMTENFGVATANFPGKVHLGSVGQTWRHGEIRIDDNGEILTKSPATMKGYYKEKDKTDEVLSSDGWLRTGDKGRFDNDGRLFITGRVKDLFKTSKGKYIAPAPIESKISSDENIEQVCVLGSGLPQPVAIVTLSDMGQTKTEAEIKLHFESLLEAVNNKLEGYERLSNIVITYSPWTPESGVLTPTLKIKRNVVENQYNEFIMKLEKGDNKVLVCQ